jgi:hypothetical protein
MSIRTPSERVRLIRLLRTHGLRAVERLRADELKVALDKLGLTLPPYDETLQGAAASSAPSSAALQREPRQATPSPDVEAPVDSMISRFKEPAPLLPEGDRTFLRLIAVDPEKLFITWDLSAADRARVAGGAHLKLRIDEEGSYEHGDFVRSERIDPASYGWYLPAPEERTRFVAALTTLEGELVAVSNPAIVPPSRAAPPGPLRFATVPLGVDRRRLRGGRLLEALIDEEAELPDGVSVSEAGRTVRSQVHEPLEDAPSSSARIPLSRRADQHFAYQTPSSAPSSHLYKAPSSSGMLR